MTIKSRWENPLPRCSLQQWIFGSSRGPLSSNKILMDADRPETHYLTMSDFRLLAKRVALGLQAAGLKPGERVLVFSGNNVWFPAVFLGILMAGGVFTGANPGFVTRELAYQLRDSGASFLLAAPQGMPVALEAAAEAGMPRDRIYLFEAEVDARAAKSAFSTTTTTTKTTTSKTTPPSSSGSGGGGGGGTRHWAELLHSASPDRAEAWDWAEAEDPFATVCCLNYSSGTTGVPKGVEISHGAYVANGEGVVFITRLDPEAEAKLARAKALCFLPLYHAYAQTYFVANLPRLGVPVYVMPTFDFPKMLAHVQRHRITLLTLVPPIVVALAKHPLSAQFDLSSVESVGCGAAPLGREAAEEAESKIWPGGGVTIRQGWGMTEVTCTCMSWDPTQPARATTAVGELMPNCSARLVETDGSGRFITEADRAGELWVSGPTMMRGYWRNPSATAATVVTDPADGSRWLRTGDVAYVEGEYRPGAAFHIVDRMKELIKVKGNQVAPAELEAVLLERADLADAAVVGVTVKGEEMPRAYVVPTPGLPARPDPREIARWFEGKVARYKRLRGGVVFVDAIPKNPSGKILRKILRDRARSEVGDKESPPTSKLS